jgi:hypothetical protein
MFCAVWSGCNKSMFRIFQYSGVIQCVMVNSCPCFGDPFFSVLYAIPVSKWICSYSSRDESGCHICHPKCKCKCCNVKIPVFWDMLPYRLVCRWKCREPCCLHVSLVQEEYQEYLTLILDCPQGGGSKHLEMVGIMAQHPRRLEYLATLLWEPQLLKLCCVSWDGTTQ